MAPLSAQFTSLIAPGAGIDVYLASNLPLKGSGKPQQGRIFKIGTTPLTTVADVPNSGLPDPCLGLCWSSGYDLSAPDLSRDGTVVVYTGRADCGGSQVLCAVSPYSTTVQDFHSQSSRSFDGTGRLSGNGRFLAVFDWSLRGYLSFFRLYDLQTGTETDLPPMPYEEGRFTPDGRAVADDGTFVIAFGQIMVYRHGKFVTTGDQRRYSANPVINATGDLVVYQVCCSPSELHVFRPDTGEDSVLVRGSGYYKDPVLTADGRILGFLALANPGATGPSGQFQLCLINVDGSGMRTLTSDPEGLAQFTLSDDGQNAWYVPNLGALYQLTVASGEAQQRIPPSAPASLGGSPSPGSALLIYGGFTADPSIKIAGLAAPVAGKSANGIWMQVPWETPAPQTVSFVLDRNSPFDSGLPATVETRTYAPQLQSDAIRQDWSGRAAFAAHPGETVHFYLTGLGPVTPPQETGAPAPATPLSVLTTPLRCNVPVLFAGLAPGLLGFYQVDLQIHAGAMAQLNISCESTFSYTLSLAP